MIMATTLSPNQGHFQLMIQQYGVTSVSVLVTMPAGCVKRPPMCPVPGCVWSSPVVRVASVPRSSRPLVCVSRFLCVVVVFVRTDTSIIHTPHPPSETYTTLHNQVHKPGIQALRYSAAGASGAGGFVKASMDWKSDSEIRPSPSTSAVSMRT